MPYEFFIKHLNRDGTIKNAYIVPLRARYTNSVANDEPLTFTLEEGAAAVTNLAEWDIILFYIRNLELEMSNAGDFILDFVGILRDTEVQTDGDGVTTYSYTCPNEKHLLRLRSILWPADTSNRSDFDNVAAETVLKTLVQYNATSDATTGNGRWQDGDLSSGMGYTISIETDAGQGNSIGEALSGDNLLEALQQLRRDAGGDWSIKYQSGATFLFSFHLGQLGSDKTSGANAVTFSLAKNNLRNPRLKRQNRGTATRALVAGQGSEDARITRDVNGADYATNNDIELFVDARDLPKASQLDTRGAIKLDERRPKILIDFDVNQTSDTFYSRVAVTGRKTYREGDLVKAVYAGETFTRKIKSVSVSINPSTSSDYVQISIDTEAV